MSTKLEDVKPLNHNVFVRPLDVDEKTAGGIIIPDSAKEKPQMGEIVAAGPGLPNIKMEVKLGDKILYGKEAGTPITIQGKDYTIMTEEEIFAII